MKLTATTIAGLAFASFTFADVSPEKELGIGREMVAQIDSTHQPMTDSQVTDFVERVVKDLSSQQMLRFTQQIRVFQSPDRVASSLPGGFIVISSGAILQANTESELAAMLAHALGHGQAAVSTTASPTGLPLIFMGGAWGLCMRSAGISGLLMAKNMTEQARTREAEADTVALKLLVRAGYEPEALATAFNRWSGGFGPADALRRTTSEFSARSARTIVNTSAFEEMKARLLPSPRHPPALVQ